MAPIADLLPPIVYRPSLIAYRLSRVAYRLSRVACRVSLAACRLSAPLSAYAYRLSLVVHSVSLIASRVSLVSLIAYAYRLSPIIHRVWTIAYRLSPIVCRLSFLFAYRLSLERLSPYRVSLAETKKKARARYGGSRRLLQRAHEGRHQLHHQSQRGTAAINNIHTDNKHAYATYCTVVLYAHDRISAISRNSCSPHPDRKRMMR